MRRGFETTDSQKVPHSLTLPYEDGMTRQEADYFRKHFVTVYACAECVRLDLKRRYWWQDQLRIVGFRNLCPPHFGTHIDGLRAKDSHAIGDEHLEL
jgi:hypothetical protein